MIDNACEWGASTFLIFSENVGTLVYYTHMFPLLISLFISIIVLFNNPKVLINRVFFFMTLMFSIWVYFDLILWASPSPQDVMFFWSSIVPIEMLMYLSGLYLVYLFYTNKKDAPVWLKSIFAISMIPIILLMHTSLNVVGLSPDCDEGAIEGALIQYMYVAEFVIIFIIGYLIYRGRKKLTNTTASNKLTLVGGATLIFLLFFSAGNLTLLFSMGPFYEQYKLFGMPIFATVVAYSFIKYKTFGVKIIITEILVASLVIILFSTILIEKMSTARPFLIGTLFVSIFIGYQLIRSVRKEVGQRQEIEKLANKLKRANKRLKALDQMKSEFVSIASHQLRSPLTAIRGYTSMLLEGSYGKINKKALGAIERIGESSHFMAESVEDYLSVSRIQAGNMKYTYSDFNLRDDAEHVADDIRREAMRKGLLVIFKSDLNKTGIVHADVGKTRQILYNLINNALKYTPKGTITIFVHDQKKEIYVDIIDSGIGMSTETLENVFAKFERAHNANKVNVTGTGLGLYIARKIAREMKGDVTAFSDGEGRGSTFRLTLPIQM